MTGKQVAILAASGAAGMAGTGILVGGLIAGSGKFKLRGALMGAGIGALVGAIFTPLAGWVTEATTNAVGTAGVRSFGAVADSRLAPRPMSAVAMPSMNVAGELVR